MQKLPIGIQNFAEIRTGNYTYADKTGIAAELVQNSKYAFLSRPRRFGKSLFVDTLKEMFEGNRQLFTGLAADTQHDWHQTHPVIVISFGRGDFSSAQNLQLSLHHNLKRNEEKFGLQPGSENPTIRFDELINGAAETSGQSVVILIDEYDKPILDNITDLALASQARTQLRSFYTVLKENDAVIRFAFLTGVSKLSKVSIFSGLNNLDDISLTPKYGTICGYTQSDLETSFHPHLQGVDRSQLKKWYNGYNFMGECVYNPFDILLFLHKDKTFKSYWIETGTPGFLVNLLQNQNIYLPTLDRMMVDEEQLNSFDVDTMDPAALMYQSGYLTIKEVEDYGDFLQLILGFPNLEVATAFSRSLMTIFFPGNTQDRSLRNRARLALQREELETFHESLASLLGHIPHQHYSGTKIASYEGFYASIIFVWLGTTALRVRAEDSTSRGRVDLSIELEEVVYLIEFKVDQPGKALEQIKKNGCAEKFMGRGKRIYFVGISFNSDKRAIEEFGWERDA